MENIPCITSILSYEGLAYLVGVATLVPAQSDTAESTAIGAANLSSVTWVRLATLMDTYPRALVRN